LDGIVGVIDTYIASSDAMERLTVPTTNLTNGYVVATKELRAEAIELLDSIINTVDSEIDKGELDDEAISFLDMVIRPLLVRLRDLISSHYGDDEGVEEAKVESSTTIGNLIRLTDFGRATKSKIGGASGALVRIAAVGDALEKNRKIPGLSRFRQSNFCNRLPLGVSVECAWPRPVGTRQLRYWASADQH